MSVTQFSQFHHLYWQSCRKIGKANPIRSTYVLPDGIKHNRGFVKDPEEAQKYMSIQEKGTLPTIPQEEENEHGISQEVITVEDRSKEASIKNEVGFFFRTIMKNNYFKIQNP